MPVRVIDRLEVVQVDDHHRQGNTTALIGVPRSDEMVFKHDAVGQTGQVILLCLLLEYRERVPQLETPRERVPAIRR